MGYPQGYQEGRTSMTLDAPIDVRWILIPARAGSKGIPQKNLRLLAGKPLILHALDSCLQVAGPEHVIVSTDDEVIAALVREKCRLHVRPKVLADDQVTLDEVAVNVAEWLVAEGASESDLLLTVQPTSPLLPPTAIRQAFTLLDAGAGCAISVKDDTHLRWAVERDGTPKPLFSDRLNRQWLPRTVAETGGLVGSRIRDILATGTRINPPVSLVELGPIESIDIDSPSDWCLAEFYSGRKRVALRADGSPQLGMGHLYRALALSANLAQHETRVISRCDGDYAVGARFLQDRIESVITVESEEQFHKQLADFAPDIAMLDVLDTTEEFVQRVRKNAPFVVSFEDLGPGSMKADIVVNDLYSDPYPIDNHWYGIEYSLIAPQFEALGPAGEPHACVREVLVTFGGSDPSRLTLKALAALGSISSDFNVTAVLGPAYHENVDLGDYGLRGKVFRSVESMAALMHQSDLAITSAGRTVTELVTQGIPTIVMCQNLRELQHTHASSPYGVMNLGLGEHVSVDGLQAHIGLLANDHHLRVSMYNRMIKAASRRSNEATARRLIEAAAKREALS